MCITKLLAGIDSQYLKQLHYKIQTVGRIKNETLRPFLDLLFFSFQFSSEGTKFHHTKHSTNQMSITAKCD